MKSYYLSWITCLISCIFSIKSFSTVNNDTLSFYLTSEITIIKSPNFTFTIDIHLINEIEKVQFQTLIYPIIHIHSELDFKSEVDFYLEKGSQFIPYFNSENAFYSCLLNSSYFYYKKAAPLMLIDSKVKVALEIINENINTKIFPIFLIEKEELNQENYLIHTFGVINYHKEFYADRYGRIINLVIRIVNKSIFVIFESYIKVFSYPTYFLHYLVMILLSLQQINSIILDYFILNFVRNEGMTLEEISCCWAYLIFLTLKFTIKCILTFLSLYEGNGLQIENQPLTRNNSKMTYYIISLIFINEIIGGTNVLNLECVGICEMLNCIISIMILWNVIQKYTYLNKYLHRRLIQARIRSRHLMPALCLKKVVAKRHCLTISLFSLFNIFSIIILRYCYSSYYNETSRQVRSNLFQLILMITLIIVYFPRELPPYYVLSYEDEDRDSDMSDEILRDSTYYMFTNTESKITEQGHNESNLVIIVNPFTDQCNNNNISIFNNIKVGYFQSKNNPNL